MEDMPTMKPETVLDGADMNQDLHQLVGYIWGLALTHAIFPSSHCAELCTFFLEKHRKETKEDQRYDGR